MVNDILQILSENNINIKLNKDDLEIQVPNDFNGLDEIVLKIKPN